MTDAKQFIRRLPDKMLEIDRLIKGVKDKMEVLDENLYYLEGQEMSDIWDTFARPREIQEEQGDCIELLDDQTGVFKEELLKQQQKLNFDIMEIDKEFQSIKDYKELVGCWMEASRRTEQLYTRIDETIREVKQCNSREGLFGMATTDFSDIKVINEKFNPFLRLWTLAQRYYNGLPKWIDEPIENVDLDVPQTVDEAISELRYLQKKYFKSEF